MLRSPARLLLLGLLLCLSWILPGPGGSAAWAASELAHSNNIVANLPQKRVTAGRDKQRNIVNQIFHLF